MKLLDLRNWLQENDVDDIWWMSVDGTVYTDPVSLNEAARNKEFNPLAEVMVLPVAYADVAEPPWQELDLDDPQVEPVQGMAPDTAVTDMVETPEILEPEPQPDSSDNAFSEANGIAFENTAPAEDILIPADESIPAEDSIPADESIPVEEVMPADQENPDSLNPPVQDLVEGPDQDAPLDSTLESEIIPPEILEESAPPAEEEVAKPEKGKKKGSKKEKGCSPVKSNKEDK